MTKIYRIIALFIISTCISCCNEHDMKESIVVTYFPGLPEFYKDVTPPVFENVIDKPLDTLYISKEIYTKLKEYASSKEAFEHSNKVDVRLLMTIDTTKTYFGMFPYGYNPSDKAQEMANKTVEIATEVIPDKVSNIVTSLNDFAATNNLPFKI